MFFGSLGMLLFRDNLVKLHFSGISDTLGFTLFLFAFWCQYPAFWLKWLVFLVFVVFCGPITTMAIARGIFERNRQQRGL